MAAKERVDEIKTRLLSESTVRVSTLAQDLSVTEETIRRDLDQLESEGFLIRTHGGARLNSLRKAADTHFSKRAASNLEEKRAIARKALGILDGVHAVAADSSSTVMEVLRLIAGTPDLSILTNSAFVYQEIQSPTAAFVSTGGEFNSSDLSFYGQMAKNAVSRYRFDLALLGCKALDLEGGALVSRTIEAEIKRSMIDHATETALLVDHTKFDRTAFVQIASLDLITYIITDAEPSSVWKCACKEHGITLIY